MPPMGFGTGARRAMRAELVNAAQLELLYSNANIGIAVTIVAAPILAYFQSEWAPVGTVGWTLYMLAVAAARFVLVRFYTANRPPPEQAANWGTAFAMGAALAGAGWGTAGIFLYPEGQLMNQVFVVFVVGGMMLGGAPLLSARKESYLAFLLPAGIAPAIRLAMDRDKEHVAMALLAVLFTVAVILTTSRLNGAIETFLNLKFDNDELVGDLKEARNQADALNLQLEGRVRERTAALEESTARLRGEVEQRIQAEEALLQARKLESLGVLAGGIAHDFNNFLTVIQGNIELARLQLDAGSAVHQALDHSMEVCQRASFLSMQLLTFAKGGAPVRKVTAMSKVVEDGVRLARAGSATSIVVHIAPDLWPANVDAAQMGQALHNILLNAKQAMQNEGIVEVRAENAVVKTESGSGSGPHVRISIQDYGCGIPDDILPRIFDPYFTTKKGGTGLGLATAYAIVSKHGGHVTVNSTPGQGTTFIIDVPACQEDPAVQTPLQPGGDRPGYQHMSIRSPGAAGRLLVMDDEEKLRDLLERALAGLGYEVKTARDGAEAVALYDAAQVAGKRFDAVLLDLTVSGGMGGMETARKIKELDPSACLVVSSGYSVDPVMSNYNQYGFDDVIAKPWKTADLREVFQRVLARART